MKQFDAKLEQRLREHPSAHMRLIVRTNVAPAEAKTMLEAKGLRVIRSSSLINAVTVEGTGTAALSLCDEDWVAHVEEDKLVHI